MSCDDIDVTLPHCKVWLAFVIGMQAQMNWDASTDELQLLCLAGLLWA